ncbi:hypothetical protein BV898_10605 [Hypsibius exemplaris]|uniref:RAP domain-containing protein n=1 Tax=Hypsibius exemplaris TaxID=2072580 RepID=A0A1W0WJB7_HYPEX|nr:hypothetical protein BV898_10605 [Hypsibius exemplaris]
MMRQAACRSSKLLSRIFLQRRSAGQLIPRLFPIRHFTQAQWQPTFPFADQKHVAAEDRQLSLNSNNSDAVAIDVPSLLQRVLDPSRTRGRKQFVETENIGLRQGLMKAPQYGKTFGVASLQVSLPASMAKSLHEQMCCADQLKDLKAVVQLVSDVSCLASIARGRLMEGRAFESFAQHLTLRLESSNDLTFTDVRNLLQAFHRFHFDNLPHDFPASHAFRSAIDAACIRILPQLSREEAFLLSDLWFLSACSRLAAFPSHLIGTLARGSLDQLPPHEVVRLLFAVALQRKAEPGLLLQAERALSPHVASLSLPELAVICAAFFKTQTTPSLDFIEKILSRLLAVEFEGAPDDVAIALFAKFFNRYAQPAMHEPLQRLLQKCKTQIAALGLPALGHLCGIMEMTLQADEDFLFRVCQKVLTSMPDVRLKELAKIANICSFFSFWPVIEGQDFSLVLLRECERSIRVADVAAYPSKMVELLAAFAHVGCFSKKLLQFMNQRAFWKSYFSQPKPLLATNDLLQLHYAIEMEFPEFGRPLILESALKGMLSDEGSSPPPLNSAVSSLFNGLQKLLLQENQTAAQQSVALCSPLPYAEPMLLVRLKDLNPIPLPPDLLETGYSLRSPPSDGTCTVIIYHPWWDYTSPHQRLTGLSEMKIRHLKTLGYNVIQINQRETHNMSFVLKVKHLRDKLFFETANVAVPLDYVSDKDSQKKASSSLKS